MSDVEIIADGGRRRRWSSFEKLRIVEETLDGVTASQIFGMTLRDNEVGKAIYEDFLPAALASGRFVPAPAPEVVGHGLGALQAALARQKAGMSARKIVVSLG